MSRSRNLAIACWHPDSRKLQYFSPILPMMRRFDRLSIYHIKCIDDLNYGSSVQGKYSQASSQTLNKSSILKMPHLGSFEAYSTLSKHCNNSLQHQGKLRELEVWLQNLSMIWTSVHLLHLFLICIIIRVHS